MFPIRQGVPKANQPIPHSRLLSPATYHKCTRESPGWKHQHFAQGVGLQRSVGVGSAVERKARCDVADHSGALYGHSQRLFNEFGEFVGRRARATRRRVI